QTAQHLVVGTVEPGLVHALALQLPQAPFGDALQLAHRAEADRLRGAGLGTGRRQVLLQPVVAEGALLGDVAAVAGVDDARGAGRDGVPAGVARRLVDEHRVELGAQDGAGGADVHARRVDAVLADVRHHQPGDALGAGAVLFDELDVTPVDVG